MNKEVISSKQGLSIISMFIIGSSVILSAGVSAKQDVWMVFLIAMILAIPTTFVYARILSLYPGKDLFDTSYEIFGNTIGKIITILYTWYSFHLGALVIRNFSEFIQIVSIPETPQFAIVLLMCFICIWAVRSGIEVIGRWASFTFPYLIFIILSMILLAAPKMNFINVKPILYNGMQPVIAQIFPVWSFPYAESVLFTMVFSSLREKRHTFKIFLGGLVISSIIIILATMRNILVLGIENTTTRYFPSYLAVSLINIGDFFQRIEVLISVSFMFVGFIKISICLYVASKGVSKILNIKVYREIVAPIGLLMAFLSLFIYKDVMEMVDWAKNIYPYYAIPFQIILPLVILLAGRLRVRSQNPIK